MKEFFGRSYHKYFEGYTEKYVPGRNRKGMCIERKYTGEFYQQAVTDDIWRRQRVRKAGLYILAVLLFLYASLQKVGSNTTAYAAVSVTLCILGLFWLSYVLIPDLMAGRKLKCREYRNRTAVLASSAVTGAFFVFASASVLIYVLTSGTEEPLRELFNALLFGVGGAALFRLHICEKRVTFRKVENKGQGSADGYDIRYKEE